MPCGNAHNHNSARTKLLCWFFCVAKVKTLHVLTSQIIYVIPVLRSSLVGGGGETGAGDREKREQEAYGRREKRWREAGFPRWREAGEKGKNYATLRNISQSKKCKGAGAKKCRAGTRIKGYGKREV